MNKGLLALAVAIAASFTVSAAADDDHERQKRAFRAQLVGFNEVPAVSTPAGGSFRAQLNEMGTVLTFSLSYSGLAFNASQSHIHFGQHHTNGGISVWLCQSATNPAPAAVQTRVAACPERETGKPITGTLTAADVLGPTGQGIAANEFAELVAALRAGAAYVNVHSGVGGATPVGFPGGEIRGQIN